MANKEAVLRSELLDLFEKASEIEGQYDNGLVTKDDDQSTLTNILSQISTKESELARLVEATERHDKIATGLETYRAKENQIPHPMPGSRHEVKSLSQMFMEHPEYQERVNKGAFEGNSTPEFSFMLDGVSMLEQKTLMYSGSGDPGTGVGQGEPFESRTRLAGFLPLLYADLTFLDLFPRVPTDSELIQYVKENAFTNSAAMISEATATTGTTGTKPESGFNFTVASTTVKDVAHWIPVTNKMMRNAPQLRGLIDQRLVYGLDDKVDDQILNGAGTGNELTGLLNAGIQTQGIGTDSVPDAIHKAITKCRVTGLVNPDFLIMHPNDWQQVRLLRENAATGTLGNYLWGSPSVAGPMTMWGMPVLLSQQITENTALVGNRRQATVYDRMRTNIRVGTINDQFTRNMYTILAEMALAFVVWRPTAFCRVTGI